MLGEEPPKCSEDDLMSNSSDDFRVDRSNA